MCLFFVVLAFGLGFWAGIAGNWATPLYRAQRQLDDLKAEIRKSQ